MKNFFFGFEGSSIVSGNVNSQINVAINQASNDDDKKSKYTGVYWDPRGKKWFVQRRIDGVIFGGGRYEAKDEKKAARKSDSLIYENCAEEDWGSHVLNFP